MGKYLPKNIIWDIINNIEDEKYRDIATLQYLTGARASEIITLKTKNIDIEPNQDKIIRLRLIGKGDKTRITYIDYKYKELLMRYIHSEKEEYLFFWLMKKEKTARDEERYNEIQNIRTYYYKKLVKSAELLGINNFGTHNLRRNFAQEIRKQTKDIFMVKKILGHSHINTTISYFDDNPEDIKDILLENQK